METSGATRRLTAEEFQKLSGESGYRYELVRGRVLRSPGPGPRHGQTETNVVLVLGAFVRRHGLGHLLSGGASYVLERGPDTVRGPDISFVSAERLRGGRLTDMYLEGAPDLAIEILSPSNRPAELRSRLAEFFRAGCREAWVLDPRRRTVTVHTPDGGAAVLGEDAELTSSLLPGFRCRVAAFFEAG